MKLNEALKFMFYLFCVITTFEVLFVAISSSILAPNLLFDMWDLLKLPFVAFSSVLPVLILVRRETAPRMELRLRKVLHFVLTAAVVSGLLIYFGWMYATNAIFIAAFFLAIYIAASVIQEIREKKLAQKLNKQINAFHDAENATHHKEP